ncbi:MAG: hypothetical protein V1707_02540 [bacterium]
MQAEQLQKVLDLTAKTGETCVVIPDNGDPLVVVPFDRYQKLSKSEKKPAQRPLAPNFLSTAQSIPNIQKKPRVSLETDEQFLIEPVD